MLERSRSEFAIKAPFWPWLGLKEVVAGRKRFDIRSRLGGHLHGDDPPAQDDCKAHGPWPESQTQTLSC